MSTIIGGSSPSITFSDSTTQASAGLVAGGTIATGTITTATVTTLNAPSGVLATQNGMTGIPKAWGSWAYTGSTTVPTLNASYNISSLTQISQGIYTISFTTAMSNANYAVTTCGNAGDGSVQGIIFNQTNKTTSSFRIYAGYPKNTTGDLQAYSWAIDLIVCGT